MARKRMPSLRVPKAECDARLEEVNAFLKHVKLEQWEMPDHAVSSLGGYIVYVFLTDKRTGTTHTFNRFDEQGVEELRRLSA